MVVSGKLNSSLSSSFISSSSPFSSSFPSSSSASMLSSSGTASSSRLAPSSPSASFLIFFSVSPSPPSPWSSLPLSSPAAGDRVGYDTWLLLLHTPSKYSVAFRVCYLSAPLPPPTAQQFWTLHPPYLPLRSSPFSLLGAETHSAHRPAQTQE